ncbi:hypothetical protein [Thalassobaculum litoreum]|uniref:Uncharacterized protein n=1 Tax=Thalassobaculum litoreum DSM 18839 TaxID=1123362 RepID=A0A8G2BED2_9PROT|nr:hypothetical protein [Thalassobaculum litoreum]SDF15877.1 hypothetical protein SAMN05660686_00502 [Thalassobaculum litoreum DSM 18839]
MTGNTPDVEALRCLLLDMVTPDEKTTTVGEARHVLPLADRLAAILAPHLSPADKLEVSRRMAALQATAREGTICG